MGMMRDQIDLQLARIAAEARQVLRENGDDAVVSQLVVTRTRELLRSADLDDHLHICDTAQHLLLTLGLDDDDDTPSPGVLDDPDLIRAVQLRDGPPPQDAGLELLEDPFDVDAFLPPEAEPEREESGGSADAMVVEAAPAVCTPVPAEQAPIENDRRSDAQAANDAVLRQGLTQRQLATLDTMSHFGWTLKFVRRPMFLPPVPVAFDRNRQRYVVIEPDGSVDEDHGLVIRD